MSTPDKWEKLPKKPTPEKYQYRGDYVNERNRKLTQARKLAQKQKKTKILDRVDSSCETSLLVTPRSLSNTSAHRLPASESESVGKKWDTYCQHISAFKVSEEEEHAREQNKSKFTTYLRAESTKRREKSSHQPKKENVEVEPQVKQRKPRVPRLSRLARSRSRENNENKPSNNQTPRLETKENRKSQETRADGKSEQVNAGIKPAKIRYLDFISKKIDKSPKSSNKDGSVVTNRSVVGERNATTEPRIHDMEEVCDDNDDDDESTFRLQIERIVERAAEMVLSEQQQQQVEHVTADVKCNTSTADSVPNNKNETRRTPTDTGQTNADTQMSTHHDLSRKKSQLDLLEEQVKSVSASVVNDNDAMSMSSSWLEGSFPQHRPPVENTKPASIIFHETPGDGDSLSEAMVPRNHTHPMEMPTWQMNHLLHDIDSSSSAFDSAASEGSTAETQKRPSQLLQQLIAHMQYGSGVPSLEGTSTSSSDLSSWNHAASETLTEEMPRKQAQPTQGIQRQAELSLQPHPELPPQVYPSVEPSVMDVQWEEEPLPRGYETASHLSQHCQGNGTKTNGGGLVDDMFSLLG